MAVYTDVSADDLARFLSDYDIGELLSYKGIAEGVENSNFLVHTSAGNFILTLYEKRVAEGDLPFFIGLDGASGSARVELSAAGEKQKRRRARAHRRAAGGDRDLSRWLVDPASECRTLCRGRRSFGAAASGGRGFQHEAAECVVGRKLAAAVRTCRRARRQRAAGPVQ